MSLSTEQIRAQVAALGPWFHNLDLGGVMTAPDHFLGDYPQTKWRRFADSIPQDLAGCSVLDIGCNAGFYSLEMKRRGADRVLGIDFDDAYLAQARFAAEVSALDVRFEKLSVYDVANLQERFDVVLFMGVLYHLRHPLLALDLVREHEIHGVEIAREILERHRPEGVDVEAVLAIIDGHDTTKQARSVNDAVMKDADKGWRATPHGVKTICGWYDTSPVEHVETLEQVSNPYMLTAAGRAFAEGMCVAIKAEAQINRYMGEAADE